MESRNAELSLLLNKLQSEEAALRDSLVKVGGLNESLAQDKTDLNAYIIQVFHFKRNSCLWEEAEAALTLRS